VSLSCTATALWQQYLGKRGDCHAWLYGDGDGDAWPCGYGTWLLKNQAWILATNFSIYNTTTTASINTL
jgi:hypothetical protein